MSLNVDQVDLGSEDFDIMFGNKVPEATPSADTLIGAEGNQPQPQANPNPAPQGNEDPDLDLKLDEDVDVDELLGVEKPKPKKQPKAKEKQEPEAVPNPKAKPEPVEETPEPEAEEGAEGESEAEGEENQEIVDFKEATEFLIEKGIWQDFEGKEKMQYDAETFGELWKQQSLSMAEGYFNELVDQSGPYGRAILEFAKNGGNPEQILDLFRESKRVQNLDTSTPENQEAVTREYYKTLNWSKDKIEKEIRKKKEDLELEEEAAFAKTQLEERVEQEVKAKQKAQEERLKEQDRLEKEFSKNIGDAIKNRTDLSETEKKEALKSLLSYDKKLEDGRYVNQFYIDFMKMQADPSSYIDLVLFVRDKNKFIEKLSKKAETSAAKKTFNFIKGNAAVSSKKDSGYAKNQTTNRKERDLVIPIK